MLLQLWSFLLVFYIWMLPSHGLNVLFHPSDCMVNTFWIPGSGLGVRQLLETILSAHTSEQYAESIFESDIVQVINIQQATGSRFRWNKFGNKKHDGWLYGSFGDDLTSGDVFYVYSNMHTAIRGKFKKGQFVHGVEVTVTHYRCWEEFLELQFSEPVFGSPVYTYEEPTEKQLTRRPTLMDPLDRFNVYVGPSTLGGDSGEGLFARRNIRAGEPICIYAGAVIPNSRQEAVIYFPNMTLEDREERHKNLLNLDEYVIDVPDEDVVRFRASLGHKAQHSFKPNAAYHGMKGPRFGKHRCVEALENIEEDEEIFVSYNYQNFKTGFVPRWYRDLFAREFPDRAYDAYPDYVRVQKHLQHNKR